MRTTSQSPLRRGAMRSRKSDEPLVLCPDYLEAFRQGLRELGYSESQNLVIAYRYAEGRDDRLADLAAELVRLKMEVIVTIGGAAVARLLEAIDAQDVLRWSSGYRPKVGALEAVDTRTLTRPCGRDAWGNVPHDENRSLLDDEQDDKRRQLARQSKSNVKVYRAVMKLTCSSHSKIH
jgi:hypothetical protein